LGMVRLNTTATAGPARGVLTLESTEVQPRR